MVNRAELGRVLGQEDAIFNKEISVGIPVERAAKQMPSGNVLEGTSTCCVQQLQGGPGSWTSRMMESFRR